MLTGIVTAYIDHFLQPAECWGQENNVIRVDDNSNEIAVNPTSRFLFLLNLVIISSIYTQKSIADSIDPCFTPLVIMNDLDTSFPHLTLADCDTYMTIMSLVNMDERFL